jgi:hypothetical protein
LTSGIFAENAANAARISSHRAAKRIEDLEPQRNATGFLDSARNDTDFVAVRHPTSSLSMEEGQLSAACHPVQRLKAHDLPIIGLAKNAKRFIDPAAHCRCDFQWFLRCDCSASAMRRIGSLTYRNC